MYVCMYVCIYDIKMFAFLSIQINFVLGKHRHKIKIMSE